LLGKEGYTLRPIVVFNLTQNKGINSLFLILLYKAYYYISWQPTYFKEKGGLRLNTLVKYKKRVYISIFIKDIFKVMLFILLVIVGLDNIRDVPFWNPIFRNLSRLL
jgi:hypothetical protein